MTERKEAEYKFDDDTYKLEVTYQLKKIADSLSAIDTTLAKMSKQKK